MTFFLTLVFIAIGALAMLAFVSGFISLMLIPEEGFIVSVFSAVLMFCVSFGLCWLAEWVFMKTIPQ